MCASLRNISGNMDTSKSSNVHSACRCHMNTNMHAKDTVGMKDEGDMCKKGTMIGASPSSKPITLAPPRNRKEALLSPWWPGYYEAEKAEMKSHDENGTWMLIPRSEVPPGVPVLRDRWAYDDKLAPGGKSIERFKARLTAMGCFQKAGIDYTASVMSTRMFRYLLQIYNSEISSCFSTSTGEKLKDEVWQYLNEMLTIESIGDA